MRLAECGGYNQPTFRIAFNPLESRGNYSATSEIWIW